SVRLCPDRGLGTHSRVAAGLLARIRGRDSPRHDWRHHRAGDRRDQPRSRWPAWHVIARGAQLSLRRRRQRRDRGAHGWARSLLVDWRAIFIGAAVLCIPALIALTEIRPDEIDYIRARNATKRDHSLSLQRLIDLVKNWRLVLFAGCMVLFHFSTASLLPLVSENLAHSKIANSALFMAGLIVIPQLVVAILAPWIGYWSELWGRKPLLLAGFAVEAARAVLFTLVSDPLLMMAVQLFDGVSGAVITVLTILVVTDLTTGTGRFNLAQGVLGTLTGTAAAISTGSVGFLVQQLGDLAGFVLMAAATTVGAALLWAFLPETKPAKYVD